MNNQFASDLMRNALRADEQIKAKNQLELVILL